MARRVCVDVDLSFADGARRTAVPLHIPFSVICKLTHNVGAPSRFRHSASTSPIRRRHLRRGGPNLQAVVCLVADEVLNRLVHCFTGAGTIDASTLSHDGTYPNMEISMSTRKLVALSFIAAIALS